MLKEELIQEEPTEDEEVKKRFDSDYYYAPPDFKQELWNEGVRTMDDYFDLSKEKQKIIDAYIYDYLVKHVSKEEADAAVAMRREMEELAKNLK